MAPSHSLPALSANWEGDADGFQIAGFVSPGPRYLHLEKACLLVECRAENISLHKYINLSFTSHEILHNKRKTQRNRSEYFILGLGRESAYNSGNLNSIPGVRKIPWRRPWQPTPIFSPGESHGQRSLVGYSPQGHRVRHDWATNTYPRMRTSRQW